MRSDHDDQTYAIIGAAHEAHRELGPGFVERVYHEAMIVELEDRGIPVESEVELGVYYKGRRLSTTFRVDLLCYGAVIVELKALPEMDARHLAQALNYLKISGLKRALLLNFGRRSLERRRVVL